jgi:hypothetical protein
MTIETTMRKSADVSSESLTPAPAPRTYSPEYLAEQAAIMARVREEGAKRIRRDCDRLLAMGIVDKNGNRLKKELPADMLPGADRDFGG